MKRFRSIGWAAAAARDGDTDVRFCPGALVKPGYRMHHVDLDTPWEEIRRAMEQLVREGKILCVGAW